MMDNLWWNHSYINSASRVRRFYLRVVPHTRNRLYTIIRCLYLYPSTNSITKHIRICYSPIPLIFNYPLIYYWYDALRMFPICMYQRFDVTSRYYTRRTVLLPLWSFRTASTRWKLPTGRFLVSRIIEDVDDEVKNSKRRKLFAEAAAGNMICQFLETFESRLKILGTISWFLLENKLDFLMSWISHL